MKLVIKNNKAHHNYHHQEIAAMQSSIKQMAKSISVLISNQTSQSTLISNHLLNMTEIMRQKQFESESDPRFRFIRISIPNIANQSSQQKYKVIRQFMGLLCKKVFQHGFAQLFKNQLKEQQVKVYCSQNIIYSTVQLIKINCLNKEQVRQINSCLSEQILPYFTQKYPHSEGSDSNTAFGRLILPKNNIDDEVNDLILKSGIEFSLKESGNYNSQIMMFINYFINLSESVEKQFKDKMQNYFSGIFVEQKVNKMEKIRLQKLVEKPPEKIQNKIFSSFFPNAKSIDSNLQHLNQSDRKMEKTVELIDNLSFSQQLTSEHLNKVAKYKQKVNQYTQYRIGKKLPSGLHRYTQKQIQSGQLKLECPALSRILTKWCEELEKCFEPQCILNREKPFKMMSGQMDFLDTKSWNKLLHLLLKKQKTQIIKYKQKILQHSNEMHRIFGMKDTQSYNIYSPQESTVGCFAVAIQAINQNYLIGYLNKLIHSILSVMAQYCELIEKGLQEGKDLEKITEQNLESYIQKYQRLISHIDGRNKTPNLITFKVADLLRCKCSSKQRQIVALYKQLQRISYQQPDSLKIIRVKNKLNQPTKDILINVKINNTYLAEIQLAITTGKSKFRQTSSYFRHYIYQLRRAQFGALNEMCNIWANKDDRSKIYKNQFESDCLKRKNCIDFQEEENHCYQKKEQELPFLCNFCQCFYYGPQNDAYDQCQKCSIKMCYLCKYDKSQDEKRDSLSLSHKIIAELMNPQKFIMNLQQKVTITNKTKPGQKPIRYIRAETFGKIFLFPENNKTEPAFQFSKNIFPSKGVCQIEAKKKQNRIKRFLSRNVIQRDTYDVQEGQKQNEEINQNFIIPGALWQSHKSEKNCIALVKVNITEEIFKRFFNKVQKQKKSIKEQSQEISDNSYIQNQQPDKIAHAILQFASESRFNYLKKLNLSQNNLSDISVLTSYSQLETLILNHNNISQFPKNYWKHLKVLKLSHNKLKSFNTQLLVYEESSPFLLFADHQNNKKIIITKIEEIHLDHNQLTTLKGGFKNMLSLKILNLTDNQLSSLPESIGNLMALKILIIKQNKFTKLPRNIGNLINLETLNVARNELNYLPYSLGKLESLKLLLLMHNKLTNMPQNLQNLKCLEVLNMSKNVFKNLPKNLYHFKKLRELKISGNNLKQIPKGIGKLQNLNKLGLSDNLLCLLPQEIGKLKQIQQLKIAKNKITKLPEFIGELSSLKILFIQKNLLKQLPETFTKLSQLQKLDLSQNQFSSLPNNFDELTSLKSLDITNNQFKELPLPITNLSKLQELKISSNQIRFLPQQIANLKQLKTLQVHNNHLKTLPESIADLNALKNLNLSSNQFASLPEQIGRLTSLECLFIDNNRLKLIPQSISNLINLTKITLYNNIISEMPKLLLSLPNIAKNSVILDQPNSQISQPINIDENQVQQ